jgi:hypothetical protein
MTWMQPPNESRRCFLILTPGSHDMAIDVATTYAVLVGVSKQRSRSDLRSLPSVAKNLEDLREVLMDPLVLGLAEHQVRVVADPARADDVGLAIAEAARASARGTLIVYFAGHGLPDENSDLYLALADTRRDELPWRALPFRHLRSAIKRSYATHRVLILDCCFSGLSNSDAMAGNDPIVDGSGIGGAWTLYSSSDSETSLAPQGERNTAFTGELLQVLRVGIPVNQTNW